jgi:TP901 family phage tail tape measure protein
MADEIGKAMQKVGGTAGALDVNFEKVSSWIAVISSRTRESAETIGQSVKSIMARIQNMKEKGFDEEDGTKVNQVAKALNAVGVQLMDNQGQFRNFGTVMDELGAKWKNLDSRQKAYVSTTVAGTYQQSRFLNLMEGYSQSVDLYKKSLDSAGTSQKKFDLYQQGTEAQLNKLKATWEGVWQSSFNSDAINNAVNP